jgi:hypothetical protein
MTVAQIYIFFDHSTFVKSVLMTIPFGAAIILRTLYQIRPVCPSCRSRRSVLANSNAGRVLQEKK